LPLRVVFLQNIGRQLFAQIRDAHGGIGLVIRSLLRGVCGAAQHF
jgi:hypothetical protein